MGGFASFQAMNPEEVASLRAQIYDRSQDYDGCNRAALRLRRVAYAQALIMARHACPDLPAATRLTGMTPEAKLACKRQWLPLLNQETLNTTAWRYRCNADANFLSYRRIREFAAIGCPPMGWAPQRFELAIWQGEQLAAVSSTSHNPVRESRGHLGVGLVVNSPQDVEGLRGKIGILTHCAALAWAQALELKEIHYLGEFSSSGEKMMQRLTARYNLAAEPRGCVQYKDTMRFSVVKNLRTLGASGPC